MFGYLVLIRAENSITLTYWFEFSHKVMLWPNSLCTGPLCSFPELVWRGVAFTWVQKKNPANQSWLGPEIGSYGKVEYKSDQFIKVPFFSSVKRETGPVHVHFLDLFGFCTGDTRLVSMTTSINPVARLRLWATSDLITPNKFWWLLYLF